MAEPRRNKPPRFPFISRFFRRIAAYSALTFRRFPLDGAWLPDLWGGDAELGKHIANRRFILADADISFSRRMGWDAREATPAWLRELHGFSWLCDFMAAQEQGGKRARHLVEDWLNSRGNLPEIAFDSDVVGNRLTHWLMYAPAILRQSPSGFQKRFLRRMQSEFFALHRRFERKERLGFPALKGALIAALFLPGCRFAYPLLRKKLEHHLHWLLEGRGTHIERNATRLHLLLRDFLLLAEAHCLRFGEEDAALSAAITQLSATVAALRHGDGGFIVFNGSLAGDAHEIDRTLSRAAAESPFSVQRGYACIHAGESRVFVDTLAPVAAREEAFNGLHAFEWSYGAERVVVNCGAYVGKDAAWHAAVRQSAAHSTLSPSAQELGDHAIGATTHRHVVRDGYLFFESAAAGYLPVEGLSYQRQMLINETGTRFSGADSLQLEVGTSFPYPFDVQLRFHLHPDVKVKRLMNGLVLLQLGGEYAGEWMFQSSAGQAVEVDDSIYLGDGGKPKSSKQIVIHASFLPEVHDAGTPWTIEWSFIRN